MSRRLASGLEYVGSYLTLISHSDKKKGRKLVTRFKSCMYDKALSSSTPAEIQEERSVVSGLAEAFMRKHVGEAQSIEQLSACYDKLESEQFAALGIQQQ